MISSNKKTIKILGVIVLAVLFLATSKEVFAAGWAHLTWVANSDQDLAGYKIYYYDSTANGGSVPSTCPDDYTTGSAVAGNVTSAWVENLIPGHKYYFALTAYDNATGGSGTGPNGSNESECGSLAEDATDNKITSFRANFVDTNTDNSNSVKKIDLADFSTIFNYYSRTDCCTGACSVANITLNYKGATDCLVNYSDYTVFLSEFGQSYSY